MRDANRAALGRIHGVQAKDAGADKIQSRVARIDAESLVRGGGGVGDLALPVFDLSRSGKQRN